MTEEQIERRVEAMIDRLDERFMSDPELTQEAYDARIREIDAWAEAQYATITR